MRYLRRSNAAPTDNASRVRPAYSHGFVRDFYVEHGRSIRDSIIIFLSRIGVMVTRDTVTSLFLYHQPQSFLRKLCIPLYD